MTVVPSMGNFQKSAPGYRSRLGVIIAKELGDIFLRSRSGIILVAAAIGLVPVILAEDRMTWVKFAHDASMNDSVMRTGFPSLLLVWTLFAPFMIAQLMVSSETIASSMEPLLASGVRRREFVVGKLLAFTVVWACVSGIVVVELASIGHIGAVRQWCPFISYFHPTNGFLAQLFLIWTFGGASIASAFAVVRISGAGQGIKAAFAAILMCAFLGWKFAPLWPLMGLFPPSAVPLGICAEFYRLPYDHRVPSYATHFPAGIWQHPDLWLAVCAGSIIITIMMIMVYVRSLERGDQIANTAK